MQVESTDFNKTVSVVMCTFNGAAFVQEQIASIIAQTYPVYELLVFDDASSDDTVEKVKEFASKHSFIKVAVNERNIGFNKNFEQAIKAATGDVIAISDQDDIWNAKKIEKMMQSWKGENSIIYCSSVLFSGTPPVKPTIKKHVRNFEGKDGRKLSMFNTISGHTILLKKELLPFILPFSEEVMYDWWIGIVAAYNGGVQYLNEILVFHRSHADNATVNLLNKHSLAQQKNIYRKSTIKQLEKFILIPNLPPKHQDFFITFKHLLKESLSKKFHLPLFFFILKNSPLIFNYKRRKIAFISYIKHAFSRTYNEYWVRKETEAK